MECCYNNNKKKYRSSNYNEKSVIMIVEVSGKQTETNFFMFDGNSFQVWGQWEEGDDSNKGQIALNINADDIEKIIVIKK